ncbi:hypothetical protein H0B56_01065 [Haloechinothrix sp. YIM 98757]|uniref:DUF5926 domain-containing protein n=1 Tax=Haloechinothrix aidingensis TaxID=2752311 RepID=A0A838A584_9PSEU|nr:hypothetical protein [Haloechinothrix aidingensis]
MGKGARKAREARNGKRRSSGAAFVARSFEGLAAEPELIALREFVPSATARLPVAGAEREIHVASVLPGAAAAMVRSDGTAFLGLQVQAKSSDVSRDLGRALRWLRDADTGDTLAVPDTTSEPVDGERLQDQLDPDVALEPELHPDFSWWLPPGERDSAGTDPAVQRANEAIMPTERLLSAPAETGQATAAYWVDAGEKAHLRWVRPEPESELLAALARLSARGELGLGDGSRYAGSFRAHGLLVPVWDLDREAHPREWVGPAGELGDRLSATLAGLADQPLDAAERRARDGLLGRQITIR